MPPTPEPPAAARLDALADLPLEVDGATCAVREVALASYPGGRRPSAVVTLTGRDAAGTGEHVAWTIADHERLAGALPDVVPRGRWRFADWADAMRAQAASAYERAALEAAALDLALRQAGTSLFRLAGVPARPVRYVVSFDRRADPVAEARRIGRDLPGVGLKIDVDPGWDDRVYAGLAALGTVAVLDFKDGGSVADHERAHAALPEALLEDPAPGSWTAATRARISVDAAVQSAADVARLPFRPAAVNLKPARMGGVLEALRAVAACAAAGIPVYVGGMFEVDVGRRQLHALAALFSADAPNDVAPLSGPSPWPARIAVDGDMPGFGAA